jgi:integrase
MAAWKKRLRKTTLVLYRYHLQQLLDVLATFGAPGIKAPKVKYGPQRGVTATPEELARLFASPPPFMRLYLLLYLQAGLRHHEMIRVTPRSWNPEKHALTIEVKGGRQRTAEITEDIERLFEAAKPFEGREDESFVSLLHGTKITDGSLRNAWQRYRNQCGVSVLVTAHDLRRTAASILYAATKDLRVPQQLLGHQTLTSTLRYIAPLAPNEARRYAELLRFDHFHSEVKQ